MLDIWLKETNKSCDPEQTFVRHYPCRIHAVFCFIMIGLMKVFYSILSSAKHQEYNLLVNQAILVDHGAPDAFDHCEAILYSMTCLYNQHY